MKNSPFSFSWRRTLTVGALAIFGIFGQIPAQVIDWHVNPNAPTVTVNFEGTPTGTSTATDPLSGWFNLQNNTFGLYSNAVQNGGVGSIVNLTRDISGTAVTLSIGASTPTNVTMGMLLLGDIGAGTNYILTGGPGSSITFNTGNGSRGLLHKALGSNDVISVPTIQLGSRGMDFNTVAGSLNIASQLVGTGSLNFYGGSALTLTGASATTFTGNIRLFSTANVLLNSATGPALGGNIVIGSGTRDFAGSTFLTLSTSRTNFDQIDNNATIRFDGVGNRNAYWKLMGGNEEVGRIFAPEGISVIENMESETVNTDSTLTVGRNNSDSYFVGHFRDRAGGSGTGKLAITKEGTGSLTLGGGEIRHTGATTINNGTLVLFNTTNFASAVTLNNGSKLEFRTTGDMTWNDALNITVPGTTTITKTGAANLTIDIIQSYGSVFYGKGGSITLNKDVDFNAGLILTWGTNLTVNAAGAGSSFASLTQMEGGAATISGAMTVTGAALFDDFGGDGNSEDVNLNSAGIVFGGTFTTRRRETFANFNTTFNGDIILEGSVGGSLGGSINNLNVLTVRNNGVLTLGAGASIRINGSILALDNAVGVNNTDRVSDTAAIFSNGGTINFNHNQTTGTFAETMGALNLQSGTTTVNASRATGGTSTLTFASVNRSAYTALVVQNTNSTAGILAGSIGPSAENRMFITNRTATDFMGGWATVASVNGSTALLDFAKYDAAVGYTPITANIRNQVIADWVATDNVRIQGTGPGAMGNSKIINSINFWQGQTLTTGNTSTVGGTVLKINSGGLIVNGSTSNISSPSNAINGVNGNTSIGKIMGGLVTDTSTYELISTVNSSGTLGVTAVIADYETNLVVNLSTSATSGTLTIQGIGTNVPTVLGIQAGMTVSSATTTGTGVTVVGAGNSAQVTGFGAQNTLTVNAATVTTIGNGTHTFSLAGTYSTSSRTITMFSSAMVSGLTVGMRISGTGIPSDAVIESINAGAGTVTYSASSALPSSAGTNAAINFIAPTALVKSGLGVMQLGSTTATLYQANTYSGGTYINGGVLRLIGPTGANPDDLLGNSVGAVNFNGGTLELDATTAATSATSSRAFRFGEAGGILQVGSSITWNVNGAITGMSTSETQGVFTKSGIGTMNVSSANNNLAAGFVQLQGNSNFTGGGNAFGFVEVQAGNFVLSGTGNTVGRIRFDGGTMTLSGTHVTNVGTAEGFIAANGSIAGDTLTFLNGNTVDREIRIFASTVVFGSTSNAAFTNTFNASSVVITNGTLLVAAPNAIAGQTLNNLVLGGGNLILNNDTASPSTFTIKTLSGNNASFVQQEGAQNVTLVIESDLNITFDGQFRNGAGLGNLGITKNGTGMLTLTNTASTYTGKTIVNGGVLNTFFLDPGGSSSSIGAALGDPANLVLMDGTGFRFSGSTIAVMERGFTVGAGVEGVSFIAAGTNSISGAATLAARLRIDFQQQYNIAYTGTGSALIILTGSNLGNNEFNIGIGDNAGSAVSLNKTGSGTWVINRANNTYTGATTILQGTLAIGANGALGASGGAAIRLAGGVLELRGVTYTNVEDIAMEGGSIYASSGTNTWAGNIYLGVNSTINVEGGVSLAIQNITGKGGLTFAGEGTLIFEGVNYPTTPPVPSGWGYGGITIQAGTLVLRYSNATENKLPNSGLTIGGGRLGAALRIEKDNAGFTTLFQDDVSGTTLNAGAHKITRAADATNIWLKMNGITRNIGATLELSGDNIITTDLLNVNGIIGGWATVALPDGSITWALNSGVVITDNDMLSQTDRRAQPSVYGTGAPDSYVRGLPTANYAIDVWGAETTVGNPFLNFLRNTDMVTSGLTKNHEDVNTLRFNQNASTVLNLTGNNTIMSGGLLITPLMGGSGPAKYGIIRGGNISAGANASGTDLIVYQNATNGLFEIASNIIDNPGSGVALSASKIGGSRTITISNLADITKLYAGMLVSGAGVSEGTYIQAVDDVAGTILLSQAPAGTGTQLFQFNQKSGTVNSGATNLVNLALGGTNGLYVGMVVSGGTLPPGATITAINAGANQITLSAAVGAVNTPVTLDFFPVNGLFKNGAGTLLLSGLNTYTGVTVLNEGVLAITTLGNAGTASSLGAAAVAPGNLVFNGGSLLFVGETGSTNRGFTNNNEALFDVMREVGTMTFSGSTVTGSPTADYIIRKLGSGTLVLSGGTAGGYGMTRYVAEDGVLRLILSSADRFARGDVSSLEVSGGTFEIYGSTGNFSQNMPQPLVVRAGASTIKVTSEGTATTMSLQLMDGSTDVVRYSGGTVHFVENPVLGGLPSVNGGTANIRLWLPIVASNVIIPWATYRDTTNFSQLGVNEFAASTPNLTNNFIGEIVSANSLSLHDIGTNATGGLANAGSWNGSIRNPSESNVTGQSFTGTTPTSASVQTLRFFSSTTDSIVTVGSSFQITSGAILLANNIGNKNKAILGSFAGATMTSGLLSSTPGVVDLIIHNYNAANDFVIGARLANNGANALALVQTGTGTTTLTNGSNSYTGSTFITGGVLRVTSALALPTASNLVLDGGVLGIDHGTNFTRGLGTGSNQVQFTGSGGFAAFGADRTVSIGSGAALTWGSGGFVPGSDMLLFGSVDATNTILFTNAIDLGTFLRVVKVANGESVVEGEMSGNLSGPGGGLIKTGAGTLKLSGTNTFSGLLVVANGALRVNTGTNLGTNGVEMSTTLESTLDTSSTIQFGSAGTVGVPITVGALNAENVNIIETLANTTFTGAVTLNRTAAMGRTFLAAGQGTSSSYASIAGTGGFTVIENTQAAGQGAVVLSGPNTYATHAGYAGPGAGITGGTVIREGAVVVQHSTALGASTVELGDTTSIKTDVKWVTNERSLTAQGGVYDEDTNGFGLIGGAGGFLNVSPALLGGGVLVGDRVLVKDETDNPEANGIFIVTQLNTDGSINLTRATDFDEASEMKYGSVVTVTQNNTTWFMAAPDVSVPNKADTDPTRWLATVVNPNVALYADLDGIVVANSIDVNATNGTGTTTVGGAATFTVGSAEFSGAVTLQNVASGTAETKTLNVTSSAAVANMTSGIKFSGIIGEAFSPEDTLSLNKTGTGRVILSGANSYHGATTVSEGYLQVANSTGLGASGSAGTSVTSGATLELSGNITIPGTEALSIAGMGVGGVGALRNVSGNNAYNGLVTLADHALIKSEAGNLTLGASPTSVTAVDKNLTIGGAGNVTMAGAVALGTGSVTKDDAGNLTFSASNTYSGGTTVNGGTLLVNNPAGGSGTGSGAVTVNNSAILAGNGYIAPTGVTAGNTSITIGASASLAVGEVAGLTAQTLDIALGGTKLVLQGSLLIDLYGNDPLNGPGEIDTLVFTGTGVLELGANSQLHINNFNGLAESAFTEGSIWKLIDWGSVTRTGSFANGTGPTPYDLPTLTGQKSWDFSQLYTAGTISIVPEPGRMLLVGLGLGAMIFRRRRKTVA